MAWPFGGGRVLPRPPSRARDPEGIQAVPAHARALWAALCPPWFSVSQLEGAIWCCARSRGLHTRAPCGSLKWRFNSSSECRGAEQAPIRNRSTVGVLQGGNNMAVMN